MLHHLYYRPYHPRLEVPITFIPDKVITVSIIDWKYSSYVCNSDNSIVYYNGSPDRSTKDVYLKNYTSSICVIGIENIEVRR